MSFDRLRPGHDQEIDKTEFLFAGIRAYSDADPILVHTFQQSAQRPVPKGENRPVIGISFFDYYRVMYAVHRGRDKEDPKNLNNRVFKRVNTPPDVNELGAIL